MTKPKSKAKKSDASERETSANENKGDDGASQSSASSAQSTKAWIINEIQTMMHGFGDCRKPLLESAKLVESISFQQMSSLLHQAAEVAVMRGVRDICLEDVIFLMRKDKVKLARLLQYLRVKELNTSLKSNLALVDDESAQHGDLTGARKGRGSCIKLCRDFLSTIDQTGELLALWGDDIVDEVKRERDLRADHRSKLLGTLQYLEFAQARRASFSRKYSINEFRDWLLKDWTNDLKPTRSALEIFSYLTYETVAQIVDLALLVKQDANVSSRDGSFRGMPTVCYNEDYPCVQESGSQSTSGASPLQTSNANSPPSPNLQTTASLKSAEAATGQGKFKGKKRKRETDNGCPIAVPSETPPIEAITPSEILEAMNRYYQPTSCMTPFSKVYTPPFGKKLLCY